MISQGFFSRAMQREQFTELVSFIVADMSQKEFLYDIKLNF